MKVKRIQTIAMAALVLVGAAMTASCDKKAESTASSGIARIACDQSFENIMQQEVEVFEYIYKNANIMPYYVDEKAALDSLLDLGNVRTIVIPRKLTRQEEDFLKGKGRHVKQHMIAVDAIALIVNPENDMDEPLSRSEIARVLEGKITRWDELGPTSNKGEIKVVFEHQGSSVVKYMRDSITHGEPFGKNVYAQQTPRDVFQAVARDKNALGIIGVSWISSDLSGRELSTEELAQQLEKNDTTNLDFDRSVRVLKVRNDDQLVAKKPYQAYIYDGSYPLYRQMWMITIATNGTLGHGFYSFVTGFQGQKLIQLTGILPAIVHPRMVQVN